MLVTSLRIYQIGLLLIKYARESGSRKNHEGKLFEIGEVNVTY